MSTFTRDDYHDQINRQLALGVDHPLNGGGPDVPICAHGIGQCHRVGEPGHVPA